MSTYPVQGTINVLPTYVLIPTFVEYLKQIEYFQKVFSNSIYAWDMRDEKNTHILPLICFYPKSERQEQYYGWNYGEVEARIIFRVDNNRSGVSQQMMITKDVLRNALQNSFGLFNSLFVDTGWQWLLGWAEEVQFDMIGRYEIRVKFNYFYDAFEYMLWSDTNPNLLLPDSTIDTDFIAARIEKLLTGTE